MKLLEVLAGSPVARAASKRDTIRKRLTDARAKRETLASDREDARAALRAAVGDEASDPEKVAGRIGKLRADLAGAEELVSALEVAVEEADAGFAAVEKRERLRIVEEAAAQAGKSWLDAHAAVVSATVALAEARGREADLGRRIERLGDAAISLSGAVGYPDVAKRLPEAVADAVWTKHGEAAKAYHFDMTDDLRPYLMTVRGLAGPEPEVP